MDRSPTDGVAEYRQSAAEDEQSGRSLDEPRPPGGPPRGGIHGYAHPGPDEGEPGAGKQGGRAWDRCTIHLSIHSSILSQDRGLLALAGVEC